MLPLSIHFTDTHILHRPSFAKPRICKHFKIDPNNIQQNSIAEISQKQFPEKTDVGSVKMVEDHCEAIAR